MRLKTPDFWYTESGLAARLLTPLSLLYGAGHAVRQYRANPYLSRVPVFCIGNLTAGGSGKTPAALAVMALLKVEPDARPCFLTRGYGGTQKGPVLVQADDAAAVGDETLLLARVAPTIVSADRAAGARLAEQLGFTDIVMDDGLQNPGLAKTLSFVVIDGASGFGNRRLLPAGPLREKLAAGLARADAFILIGRDEKNVLPLLTGKPVLRARLAATTGWTVDRTMRYLAFCGLGRPEKFRRSLLEQGIELAGFRTFPDHHRYTKSDLAELAGAAASLDAHLITTEKDAVRVPPGFAEANRLAIMPVELVWESDLSIRALLDRS